MKLAIKNQTDSAYMIDLYAEWCASCKDIERHIFANERIKSFQNRIKLYQLDITDNLKEHRDYMTEIALFGPPSRLFYNKNSIEVARDQGEPSLNDVVPFLDETQKL